MCRRIQESVTADMFFKPAGGVRTRITLGTLPTGKEIKMVAVARIGHKTGIDVLDWHQMSRVNPEGYIVAHALGYASRRARRKMYFCMLKQALWASNDILAVHAAKKYMIFIRRDRETVQESEEGLLEPMWNGEKELKRRQTDYRILRFCHAVLARKQMYEEKENESRFEGKRYGIRFQETWKALLSEIFNILWGRSRKEEYHSWKLERDDELVRRVYNLIRDIYLGEMDRKAFGVGRYQTGICFDNQGKIILEMLKNTVHRMSLEQVIYFLEMFPSMPREFLHIFRIEYARGGGAFDLKAPPLKN